MPLNPGLSSASRSNQFTDFVPPSLLLIVLDLNPCAWLSLHQQEKLSLTEFIACLLVFINAHLAFSNQNKVAVVGCNSLCAQWLYPDPEIYDETSDVEEDIAEAELNSSTLHSPTNDPPTKDADGDEILTEPSHQRADPSESSTHAPSASMYPPFLDVHNVLLRNLRKLARQLKVCELYQDKKLLDEIDPIPPLDAGASLLAGALSMALAYISKQALLQPPVNDISLTLANSTPGSSNNLIPSASYFMKPPITSQLTTTNFNSTNYSANLNVPSSLKSTTAALFGNMADACTPQNLSSRILVVSVSGDLSSQYVPIMNSIFAAQRHSIPIDVFKLYGDTLLLQQASDATGGVFLAPDKQFDDAQADSYVYSPSSILQFLMMTFLPSPITRLNLVLPTTSEVDFRTACFCHQKVLDMGWVCSICLSIFCEIPPNNTCITCGQKLRLVRSSLSVPESVLAASLSSEPSSSHATGSSSTSKLKRKRPVTPSSSQTKESSATL